MQSPFERLRISVENDEVRITLVGDEESISFGGVSPLPEGSAELPGQFYKMNPAERPEEYVITFEFDRSDSDSPPGPALARLDAHVRDVRLRVHDDGYLLEGELTSWIGYTDAVTSTSG